jgi:hypothetical protein
MSSETPSYLYWVGGGLGAVTLSVVSAAIMWFAEKKVPTVKTVGRDLILGAILFFLLLQLLPESTMSLVTGVLALAAVQNEMVDSASSSSVVAAVTAVTAATEDIELRLGVPTF